MCWTYLFTRSNSKPAKTWLVQLTRFQQLVKNRFCRFPNVPSSHGILQNGIKINPFALIEMGDGLQKEFAQTPT